jgi:vacuolar-type H+-ATPase subunit I/STV1
LLVVQGVVQQTIKDVNQSLVDDNLVQQDKIGTLNIFWSFPLKAVQDQLTYKEQLREENIKQRKLSQELEEKITEAKKLRIAKDRKEKLKQLQDLMILEKSLDKQLQEFKANDPDTVSQILEQAEINKAAADRWTDNIWAVKSYLTKKKGLPAKEVRKSSLIVFLRFLFFVGKSNLKN